MAGPVTTRQYVYRVTDVPRVVDGDTYWLTLDVGLRHTALVNVRLHGYDCPETNGGTVAEKVAGRRATVEAQLWLVHAMADPHTTVWVSTLPDPDSFGRWLGAVWAEHVGYDGVDDLLGAHLCELGLASVWPTRWRTEHPA